MSVTADYVPTDLPSAPTRYTEPRAHELRERYFATYGGDEIPVPVESIAEDLLGLRIEEDDLGECSGMLIPAKRLIMVNASEAMSGDTPTHRQRFTIAHELGHWICHANGMEAGGADLLPLAGRLAGHRPHRRARGERLRRRVADAGGRGTGGMGVVFGRVEVASRFAVSSLAAQWRLYSFGLLPKPA